MAAPSKHRPSPAELRRLYVDRKRSAQAIAERCQVEKITVLRWLKAAGIERRPIGRGLANRGIEPPTADELRGMVHEQHLSYAEIATRYGVDHTAVPVWLDKHGIRKPTVWETRYRGEAPALPDRAELTRRREAGDSLNAIAIDVGASQSTIRELCRSYGLRVERPGWREGRFACSDGHRVRSTYEQLVDNWLTEHDLVHEYEPQYPFDRRFRADFLVGETFIEVWGVTGVPTYEERRVWKVEKCKREGIRLIQVSHAGFGGRRRWWKPLEVLLEDPLGNHAERGLEAL